MKTILSGPRHYARSIFCALLLGLLGWTTQQPHSTTAQIVSEPEFSISVTRMANDLVISENGSDADNHITISRANNSTIQINDVIMGSENGLSRPGMVGQPESTEQEASLSGVSGALIINGMGGNDLLTIDLRNGSPIPSGGLIFNGGAQRPDGEGDALEILGGTADRVVHRFVNANDGSIEIVGLSLAEDAAAEGALIASAARPQITYTGLEPVTDNINAADRVFDFTGSSETIVLNSGVDANDGDLFIDSTLGESVLFVQPSASLTIRVDQGSGADTIQIEGVDSGFDADITVTADSDDIVEFSTNGTNAGSGAVQVNAESVNVGAALVTTGGVQFAASDAISVSGGIASGGDVLLSAAGDITVSGATGVNSQSGSGAIRFDAGGAINLTGAGVQGASTIDLLAGGDMLLSQVWSFSTLTNTIELTSTAGALLDGSDSTTNISAPAGTIVVRAAGGVGAVDGLGSDARLEIHGGSLDIVAGADINLINSGGVAGLNLDAGEGDIDLFAVGVITDTDGDIDLAGNRATIIGSGALGSSDSPIQTALNQLQIDTSSDAGSHYLSETDAVTVTDMAADSGTIMLYGGTFLLQNQILNPVQLEGARLGGTGQVQGGVTAAGPGSGLTPGFSPGILTITGDLTMTANSTYTVDLNGNVAGSEYDQTQVAGLDRTVDLGGAALSINLGADYVHNELDTFIIIEHDATSSTVVGNFAGLAEGETIRLPGAAFVISYVGGNGNDLVLESIPLYTVDISNGGTGGGTVSVEPVTIDGTYLPNAIVTLTATSLVTSTFDGWGGDASGLSNPLTITVDADKSVTALFNTIVYTLTTNSSGRGSGSIVLNPPGGLYEIGTEVGVEAVAGENAFFGGWSGDLTGESNPITVTMTANQEITATFKIPTYTISIAMTGDGVGTVELDPPGNVYDVTTLVTATATAASGSIFRGWSGGLSGLANPSALSVSADATVTATFELIPTYTLTLETTGDGVGNITIDPQGGSYEEGTVVTLTATSELGSLFGGWGGALSGMDNPITTTVDADGTIVATFNPVPIYTVTLQTDGDGAGAVTLDPPGGIYEEGTVITITAVANSGSLFGGWGGLLSGSANPITTTIDADATVNATFDLIPTYTLIVQSLGDGAGSVTLNPPEGSYEEGTVVTLTATAESGSIFGGWGGDAGDSASPVLTLTMDSDKSASATFNTVPAEAFTLRATAGGSGFGGITFEPAGGVYAPGTEVTVTAVPADDSTFQAWQGDVTSTENPLVVTMDRAIELIGIFAVRTTEETRVMLPFIQP